MSEERGTAQQRENGAFGIWQASRYADDPDRAAAFDLGCDCHYLEGDTHHGIGCPAYPSDCPECGAHPGNQDELCRKAISTRKATINVLHVEGGGEIKACTMCGHRLEQCRCFRGMRPIDTSKLEFRNPPDAPPVPPGWELSGIAADSQTAGGELSSRVPAFPVRDKSAWWEQADPTHPLTTMDAASLWYELKRSQQREDYLRAIAESLADALGDTLDRFASSGDAMDEPGWKRVEGVLRKAREALKVSP